MSKVMSRGALIVLEGCDRSGKTTQCKKLVEALTAQGHKAQMWRFPDRTTPIGKMVGDYLEQKCELEDHAVHLMFTANRWEKVPRMKELLLSGTTLIIDRYSFSGVAFSAAKPNLDLDWCRQPEVGLPQPDAVLYLTIDSEDAAKREAFGGERYEQTEIQKKVAGNYKLLTESNWKIVDANRSIEDVHEDIKRITDEILTENRDPKIGQLWTAFSSINGKSPEQLPSKKQRTELTGSAASNGGAVVTNGPGAGEPGESVDH